MTRDEQIVESIKEMKTGIINAVGKERGETFVGRNIEVILTCLLQGKSEAETIALCEFV